MPNPRFYIGELHLATYTMSETENASYPLANLKSYFSTDEWRGPNTAINQTLKIDLGSAKECDSMVIENHNFASLGADAVKLQAADDDAYSVNLETVDATLAALGSPGKVEFAAVTKRYWRILFEKASGALSAAPQLGQIFLNKKLECISYDFPYRAGNTEYQTFNGRNLNGQRQGHQNYAGRTVFEFKFSLQSETFKAGWRRVQSAVQGRLFPFYYWDPTDVSWYVYLAQDRNSVRSRKVNNNETDTIVLKTRGQSNPDPLTGYGFDYGTYTGGW